MAFWQPEYDAELKELAASGHTGSEAAAAVNFKFSTAYSRNATIGRMHRLGITKPRVVQNANRRAVKQIAKREQERTKPREPIAPNMEPVRVAYVAPHHVNLLDLHGCRYPFGDGPFTFCNHFKLKGSSYCPEHFELSRRQ